MLAHDRTPGCVQPAWYIESKLSTLSDDCDDTNAVIYLGAEDIPESGIDENCDGEDATFPVRIDLQLKGGTILPLDVGTLTSGQTSVIIKIAKAYTNGVLEDEYCRWSSKNVQFRKHPPYLIN